MSPELGSNPHGITGKVKKPQFESLEAFVFGNLYFVIPDCSRLSYT
jgi:hypothetical protein